MTIFISYSHQDRFFVQYLYECLVENTNYDVWYDKKITPGNDWSIEIDENIRKSFVFLLVLSPDALKSQYVNYEWAYAKGNNIPIIPILYRVDDDEIPIQVNKSQRVRFTSPFETEHDMNQLLIGITTHYEAYRKSENPAAEYMLSYLTRKKRFATVAKLTAFYPMGNYKYKFMLHAYRHPKLSVKDKTGLIQRFCGGKYIPALPELIKDLSHDEWSIASCIIGNLPKYGSQVSKPLLDIVSNMDFETLDSFLLRNIMTVLAQITDFETINDKQEVFLFFKELTRNDNPTVRYLAIQSLQPNYLEFVTKDILEPLLNDKSIVEYEVRGYKFKHVKTISEISHMMHDLLG